MKKSYNINKPHIEVRQFIYILISLFLFFYYQDSIQIIIEKYIVIKHGFSNKTIDIFIIISIISLYAYLIFKLLKDNYTFSFTQKIFTFYVFFILLFYRFSDNKWVFISFKTFKRDIQYIDLIIFLLIFYVLLFIVRETIKSRKKTENDNNIYYGDNPIKSIDDDKLKYSTVSENLISILRNENHEQSFTIGLIGPWGNGKSSVFNIVKDVIKNDDIILIDFLPFLNHNENDIINEFFSNLSAKLSKYSGELSNEILEYSKKLTTLIKDKNISTFFDNNKFLKNNKTAYELNKKINNNLLKIQKKIIVFIDDLDRLNEKEILQILKLIRNTANFRRTIFVIAMDKDYVLDRLEHNNDILSTRFIDKFFQLEIYLPEIDKNDLKNLFQTMLLNTKCIGLTYKNEVINAIQHQDNLFNNYIKNVRDIKRVVNQFIYEFPNIEGEIDIKDLLNFIYFKLKFPKVIKLLNENRNTILRSENEKFYLLKKGESSNIFNVNNSSRFLTIPSKKIKEYEVFENLKIDRKNLFDDIKEKDKELFALTLAYLFGDQNKNESYKSIKFENNFRKLMQQRVSKNDLIESDFQNLFTCNIESLKEELLIIFKENKEQQLFNRFEYFSSKEEFKIKRVIEINCIILDEFDNQHEDNVYSNLGDFTKRIFKNKKNEDFTNWLKINIFNNIKLKPKTRLLIINKLKKDEIHNELWYLKKDFVKRKALLLFRDYMCSFNNNLWDINDYSFYFIYKDSIKYFSGNNSIINNIVKSFWSLNNVELFCVQVTDLNQNTLHKYTLSDILIRIFGSKSNFYNFIKNHKSSKSKFVQEYLEFLYLFEITNYSTIINYKFKFFDLMKIRMESLKKYYGIKEKKIPSQLFFESNYKELYLYIHGLKYNLNDINNALFKINTFNNNNEKFHFLIITDLEKSYQGLREFTKLINKWVIDIGKIESKLDISKINIKENFIINGSGYYVKLISKQIDSI